MMKFISGFTLALLFACAASAGAWEARLERVVDGDSFVVRRKDGSTEKIRLYGIDAPERGQPFSRASGKHLAELLQDKVLDVDPQYKDRFGRTVAVLRIADPKSSVNQTGGPEGSLSINELQIRDGMAWHYTLFCKAPFCADWKTEENAARAERRGLWQEGKPTPPWKWKHKK